MLFGYLPALPSFADTVTANPSQVQTTQPVTQGDIMVNGKVYSEEEFETLIMSSDTIQTNQNTDNSSTSTLNLGSAERYIRKPIMGFAPALAVPFVIACPEIGAVALLAGGVVLIGGVVYAATTPQARFVQNYAKDPVDTVSSKYGIPKKLLDSKGRVKVGDFKNKRGQNIKQTGSEPFKNSNWSIEKDNAGHGDTKYKLKKDGDERHYKSLGEDGKVVREAK